MQQTSERAHHLKSSLIRDVAEKGMKMQDILPLWFGEGQWPTSQIAIEAARMPFRQGIISISQIMASLGFGLRWRIT